MIDEKLVYRDGATRVYWYHVSCEDLQALLVDLLHDDGRGVRDAGALLDGHSVTCHEVLDLGSEVMGEVPVACPERDVLGDPVTCSVRREYDPAPDMDPESHEGASRRGMLEKDLVETVGVDLVSGRCR